MMELLRSATADACGDLLRLWRAVACACRSALLLASEAVLLAPADRCSACASLQAGACCCALRAGACRGALRAGACGALRLQCAAAAVRRLWRAVAGACRGALQPAPAVRCGAYGAQ